MANSFAGKTVLVTGAASGIGAACARALAAAGVAKLVLVDVNGTALAALDLPCAVALHAGDVADEALWDRIEASESVVHAAVLNAGNFGRGRSGGENDSLPTGAR